MMPLHRARVGRRRRLTRTGPTTHALVPRAPAGSYNVILFGSGPGGDVVTSFRWTLGR